MSDDKTIAPEQQQPLGLRARLSERWANYTGIWQPAALGIGRKKRGALFSYMRLIN